MDPKDARQKLNIFVDTLPDSAFIPLRYKDINPSLLTTDIASSYEFVIRETGHICEGVRRVPAGKIRRVISSRSYSKTRTLKRTTARNYRSLRLKSSRKSLTRFCRF